MTSAKICSTACVMCLVFLLGSSALHAQQEPTVCQNRALRAAISIIEEACTPVTCDFARLRDIDSLDKAALLAALGDRELHPVSLFFPLNEDSAVGAFDWKTIKHSQLETLKFITNINRAAIFVIGRASTIGNNDANRLLSINRMRSVMAYIQNELNITCRVFYGGYLGAEIFQLGLSDAAHLGIAPVDFRNDQFILNQSVHVFVLPCELES